MCHKSKRYGKQDNNSTFSLFVGNYLISYLYTIFGTAGIFNVPIPVLYWWDQL